MSSYPDEKPRISKYTKNKSRHNALAKGWYQHDKKYNIFRKSLVNEADLTKSQRSKLKQTNDRNSEFDFNVNYSMNRKYRWNQINGAGDLVALDARVLPQHVQLEGSNVLSGLDFNSKQVLNHYHRKIDGSVVETTNRELALGSLHNVLTTKHKRAAVKGVAFALREEDEIENDEKNGSTVPVVRYLSLKIHSTPHVYSKGSYFLNQGTVLKNGLTTLIPDVEEAEDYDDFDDTETVIDEPTTSEYSSPRQQTYSLADFVTEKVSKPSTVKQVVLHKLDVSGVIEKSETSQKVKLNEFQHTSDLYAHEFGFRTKKMTNLDSEFEALLTNPDHTLRWLNTDKTAFIVDVSKRLDSGIKTSKLIIGFELIPFRKNLRIIVNSSISCSTDIEKQFNKMTYGLASKFVDTIVQNAPPISSREDDLPAQLCNKTSYQSIYYPNMLTLYSSLDCTTILNPPQFTDIAPETNEYDDFEIVNNDDQDHQKCHLCGALDVVPFSIFSYCCHSFCRRCLRSGLTHAIQARTEVPLICRATGCMASVRPEVLYALLPLPLVNFYFQSVFEAEAQSVGKTIASCPICETLLLINVGSEYGSISCVKCAFSFCVKCFKRPHFPLSCTQFASWDKMFNQQYHIESHRPDRIAHCTCENLLFLPVPLVGRYTEAVCDICNTRFYYTKRINYYETRENGNRLTLCDVPNVISTAFYDPAIFAFKSRFNFAAGHNFTKFLQAEASITTRKLALHLVELGFAWLYMNRSQKSDVWTTVKVNLTKLYTIMKEIDVAMKSNANNAKIDEKICKSNNLSKTLIDLFVHM